MSSTNAPKPKSVRRLLAESRTSGPAVVYDPNEDGTRTITEVRPARSSFKARRLSREERLAILTQTGTWPDDVPAEAWIGVQANDNRGMTGGSDASAEASIRQALNAEGIMTGLADDTAFRGNDRGGRF